MDEPLPDNGGHSAKRRRLNDHSSDQLLISQSSNVATREDSSTNPTRPVDDDGDDDDDDDVDSEPEEPEEPAYSETKEFFPECAAFDPAIEKVKAKAGVSVLRLDDILEQYAHVNKDLKNMKMKAAEALTDRPPKPKKVALVGSTAAGKSSLVNSISDSPGLAKELSAGESCTSVPMIYEHMLRAQTEAFAAKTFYLPVKRCRSLLKELQKNYERYTFRFDEDWTEEEETKYRQEASTASDTFRALFCDKSQFQSEEATVKTLKDNYNSRTPRDESQEPTVKTSKNRYNSRRPTSLLQLMLGWYTARLRGKSVEGDVSYTFCESNSTAELRANLDPLITPSPTRNAPSLWPLVKEVRIGVPSSRVLKYLTIADLPGITDTNKIRVTATHEHIRKCQALWYVVPVERPINDPVLDYVVSHFANRFPGTLAVIVTKIDRDVNDSLAGEMQKKGWSLGNFQGYQSSIQANEKSLQRVLMKLKKKSCTMAQKINLRDQEEALKASINQLECNIFKCIVDARNAHIADRLKRDKAQYIPEGSTLPIYFVSNHNYAVHKGVARKEGPILEVEDTGITALRSYAMVLAAPKIWDNQKEMLVHRLKVLFNGVYGWSQNSPAKYNRGLPDVVHTVGSLWDAISDASAERCIQGFAHALISKLREGHADSLASAMRWLSRYKNIWKPLTFLAFFRNRGKHYTAAVGQACWNEEFLEHQIKHVLDPAWESLPVPEESFDEGIEKITKALDDIPDQLENLPESVPVSVAAFGNVLEGQIAMILAEHNRIRSENKEKYANIKLDATIDQHTGYFHQAMKRCYREGKFDRGPGVCDRVKALLTNHLTNNDPLGQATDKLETALSAVAWAQSHTVDTRMKKFLKDIDRQYKLILHRESETKEESKARARIGEVLEEIMPDVDSVELDLVEIERRYQKLATR